jgi:hypothetical protein
LRSRTSSGSMPMVRATTSSSRSRTHVSTSHGPRKGTYDALFDLGYVHRDVIAAPADTPSC